MLIPVTPVLPHIECAIWLSPCELSGCFVLPVPFWLPACAFLTACLPVVWLSLQGVELSPTDDPNLVFDRHQAAGCDPANYARVHKKPRCPAKGCKERLTSINSYQCKDCSQKVCLKHRLAMDHACAGPAAAANAAGSAAGGWWCL